MKYRTTFLILILFFCVNVLMAQDAGPDFFRSIGKIYVVVGVMVTTFVGIVTFLIYIDRKIKNIENEISSHE